jgi:predicted TIM-barrel fold metal-dependent hydrolase
MQTPWGETSVSDAHVHFFSHRFFSLLAAQKGSDIDGIASLLPEWELPAREPEQLAQRWVAELDRHGVTRAALIASLPGDHESVSAAVKAYPKRFYGYFMVNPVSADSAHEVETALDGGLLQGICLFPAMHRYSLQDERVQAILEVAAAHPGTVIFVHCGVLSVGVRRKLGLPSLFDMRFSNPIEVHGIAMRHPKLPFVIPHFGAGFLREALMLCDLCPNVYLDTSSTNSWIKYLTPAIDLKVVFEKALEIAGPQRLLFGTDSSFFPRGWHRPVYETQIKILEEIGLATAAAKAVLGGNLEKILSRG